MDCNNCHKPIPHWDEEYDQYTRKYGVCRKCKFTVVNETKG